MSPFSSSFGKKLLAAAMFLTLGASTGCNHDNCYRALFPCESPLALSTASAFCAQLTPSPGLPFPSRAVSACGTSTDRYASACGCGPACTTTTSTLPPTTTITTTSTTTAITTTISTATTTTTSSICPPTLTPPYHDIPNGDFECGLKPWTVQIPDAAAGYSIIPLGHTGNNSFQMKFVPPSRGTELGASGRIISAPVTVEPNVPYQLTFWTSFDNGDAGFIGVMFNDVPQYTIDARDHGFGPNFFTVNTVDYTPSADTVTVKFEFLFGNVPSVDIIDTVTFAPLH